MIRARDVANHPVEIRSAQPRDIPRVAGIFLTSFPARVATLFARSEPALAFYRDLFELMRLARGDDFLVADVGEGCVGFLVLVRPGARLAPSLAREGFALRAVGHALRSGYLFSPRLIWRSLASLLRCGQHEAPELARHPHVYAVAIDAAHTGRGVGSRLLGAARARCGDEYEALGLTVERDNTQALALYEKLGFERIREGAEEVQMLWPLGTTPPPAGATR